MGGGEEYHLTYLFYTNLLSEPSFPFWLPLPGPPGVFQDGNPPAPAQDHAGGVEEDHAEEPHLRGEGLPDGPHPLRGGGKAQNAGERTGSAARQAGTTGRRHLKKAPVVVRERATIISCRVPASSREMYNKVI